MSINSNIIFYVMIFISFIFFICFIIAIIEITSGTYVKSSESRIDYYNKSDSSICDNNNIKNCKLQLKYTDGTNIYMVDPDYNSNIGNTTVYYLKSNPKSYMEISNLYFIPGIYIFCFILFLSIGIALYKKPKKIEI